MRSSPALAVLLLGAGCSSLFQPDVGTTGAGTSDSAGPDSDTPTDCDETITLLDPADGHRAVLLDTTVTAELGAAVRGADITLEGPAGLVSGSTSTSGTAVSFRPDAALERDTQYTATATACERTDRSTFRTICDPISANDVVGRLYDLDLTDALWLAPEGFNSLVLTLQALGYANNLDLLIQVDGMSSSELDLLVAIGETLDGVLQQDDNEATYRVDGDLSDNPTWRAGPMDLKIESSGGPFWLRDFDLQTAFSCDGDALLTVEVTSTWDLRHVQVESEPLCDTVQLYFPDIVCQACPDGVEACLYTSLISEEIVAIDGLVLVER